MTKPVTFVIALLIPTLWLIPVFTGYLASDPPDKVFLGWIRSDDFHRYGSFINQTAEEGRILYWDYSSTAPQSPRMIAIYFAFLGVFSRLSSLPAQYCWMIWGFLISAFFILVLSEFIRKHYSQYDLPWLTAFLLILFSNGFDWVALVAGHPLSRPKNFWMDGFSSFTTFHNPLKIAGIFLGLIVIHNQIEYEQGRKKVRLIINLFLIILLWMVHPNSAVPIYFCLFWQCLFSLDPGTGFRGYFRKWILLLPYIVPFTCILMYVMWMKTDAVTANIIKQYHVPFASESLWAYPARYGLVLLFGVWGLISRRYREIRLHRYLTGWLAGAVLFSIYPGMTGLLFQHMIHLPLAFLAAFPLATLLKRANKMQRGILFGALGLLFLAGDLFVIGLVSRQTAEDIWPTSLYASADALTMIGELKEMPFGGVLANRDEGNKIGWLALKPVFLGHWGTTRHKGIKAKKLRQFYSATGSTTWRRTFLTQYHIRYIWYGPHEKLLGSLDSQLPLKKIDEKGEYRLYSVEEGLAAK